jgi:hypothetical protein
MVKNLHNRLIINIYRFWHEKGIMKDAIPNLCATFY